MGTWQRVVRRSLGALTLACALAAYSMSSASASPALKIYGSGPSSKPRTLTVALLGSRQYCEENLVTKEIRTVGAGAPARGTCVFAIKRGERLQVRAQAGFLKAVVITRLPPGWRLELTFALSLWSPRVPCTTTTTSCTAGGIAPPGGEGPGSAVAILRDATGLELGRLPAKLVFVT
jgi:hypothetical protein